MTNLAAVEQRLNNVTKFVERRTAEARLIASNGKKLSEEINLASADVELYNKVAITLASIGEERQLTAQQTIEQLVTRGLQSIFIDKNLEFHVVHTRRGKTPETKFLVNSRGPNGRAVQTDVMDARGGGMAAVIGFLLRLVILLLDKNTNEPILILDETFAHVSDEYLEPLAQFIRQLIDQTNITIILVTHQKLFNEYADKVYRFEQTDGVTVVSQA